MTAKSGTWRDGQYLVTLTFAEQTETCSFALPADLPTPGAASSAHCGGSVSGGLFSASGSGVVELRLTTYSEPKTLKLELSRDDVVILSENQTLAYVENPDECLAFCHSASVELTTSD